MIAALVEGFFQSPLPCSWPVLLSAIVIGIARPSARVAAIFAVALILAAWTTAAGWLVAPLWLAGLALLLGGLSWWRWGINLVGAIAIGFGAAWSWQPCVGEALGRVLNLAQLEPLGAIGGIGAFLLGVIAVGFAVGSAVGWALRYRRRADRFGAAFVSIFGLAVLVGLYPRIASLLARWSFSLWA